MKRKLAASAGTMAMAALAFTRTPPEQQVAPWLFISGFVIGALIWEPVTPTEKAGER